MRTLPEAEWTSHKGVLGPESCRGIMASYSWVVSSVFREDGVGYWEIEAVGKIGNSRFPEKVGRGKTAPNVWCRSWVTV